LENLKCSKLALKLKYKKNISGALDNIGTYLLLNSIIGQFTLMLNIKVKYNILKVKCGSKLLVRKKQHKRVQRPLNIIRS